MNISKQLEPLKIHYGVNQMLFMQKQLKRAEAEQPYSGLKVVHNVPLFLNTVLKIEPLVVGGADVIVTSPNFCGHDPEAVQPLEKAGVKVILEHEQQ